MLSPIALQYVAEEPHLAPERGSADAAGLDLRAAASAIIPPGGRERVSTGVRVAIPRGHVGLLFGRSSLASKRDLRPSNAVGVIDADYRGPVLADLRNDGQAPREIAAGERIVQLVIVPVPAVTLQAVEELSSTERGGGGFGSTGAA